MSKTKRGSDSEDLGDGDWITRSVRFPPELHEWIKTHAKAERRSVQLDVIWLIEHAKRCIERETERE